MSSTSLFLTIVIFVLIYRYLRWAHDYFKGTDVKYVEPILPFFGTNAKVYLKMEHLKDYVQRIYSAYPDEKYVGLLESTRPLILLRDPELIKQIGIKEFNSFHDHRKIVDENHDPAFGKILFSLEGHSWREMRATLSPAFTSSKMRNMFTYMNECAKDMAKFYLNSCQKNAADQSIEIEAFDSFSRYAVDVIANSAYGLKINSLQDKDNTFFKMSSNLIRPSIWQSIKLMLFNMYPRVSKFVNVSMTDPQVVKFFMNFTKETMRNRRENNIVRHDMIHLLMEAKKGDLKHEAEPEGQADAGFSTVQESSIGKQAVKTNWTDDDLVGQTYAFFLGGVDTTTTTLTFFFYEVCKQDSILQKLQREMDDFVAENGDDLTFGSISKLKYLDMCISETLRHWPPIAFTDRINSNPFNLPPPNDSSMKSYEIKENHGIMIPIYAIHHDEKFYKNPSVFDPERFSEENRNLIDPVAFIPFGIGPRNCIGSRFALINMKAIIFHIISNFRVTLSSKTDDPLILTYNPVTEKPKNGVWIRLKPRERIE